MHCDSERENLLVVTGRCKLQHAAGVADRCYCGGLRALCDESVRICVVRVNGWRGGT